MKINDNTSADMTIIINKPVVTPPKRHAPDTLCSSPNNRTVHTSDKTDVQYNIPKIKEEKNMPHPILR